MLEMICSLWREKAKSNESFLSPMTMTELYSEVVNDMLSTYARRKKYKEVYKRKYKKDIFLYLGKIAFDEWKKTGAIRPNIIIDEFVVMPNHLHGVLIVNGVGGRDVLPKRLYDGKHKNMSKISPSKNSISVAIRFFKRQTTIQSRKINPNFSWQSNYYDRIVRNEDELNRIREYIFRNPEKWDDDRNNTENIFM